MVEATIDCGNARGGNAPSGTPGSLTREPGAPHLSAFRERSGWNLQPARADDLEHLQMLTGWIKADPDHYGRVNAAAWLKPLLGVTNLLAVDREGPVLFLRLSNELRPKTMNGAGKRWRIDIQFAPVSALRIARTLASGLPWLAEHARNLGYDELVYDSTVRRLVKFMERVGFKERETNEHVLVL